MRSWPFLKNDAGQGFEHPSCWMLMGPTTFRMTISDGSRLRNAGRPDFRPLRLWTSNGTTSVIIAGSSSWTGV